MNTRSTTPMFIRCKHEILSESINPFGLYELNNNPINLIQVVTIEKLSRQTSFDKTSMKLIDRYTPSYNKINVNIVGIRFRYLPINDGEQSTDWWYPYGLDIQRDSDYETIISAFEFKY